MVHANVRLYVVAVQRERTAREPKAKPLWQEETALSIEFRRKEPSLSSSTLDIQPIQKSLPGS
jgi:hypothetical protein